MKKREETRNEWTAEGETNDAGKRSMWAELWKEGWTSQSPPPSKATGGEKERMAGCAQSTERKERKSMAQQRKGRHREQRSWRQMESVRTEETEPP